jgi:hypothetical protein
LVNGVTNAVIDPLNTDLLLTSQKIDRAKILLELDIDLAFIAGWHRPEIAHVAL